MFPDPCRDRLRSVSKTRSVSEIYRPLALARLYGERVNLGYLSTNLWEKVSFGESLEGNSISSDEGDSLAEKYLQMGEKYPSLIGSWIFQRYSRLLS